MSRRKAAPKRLVVPKEGPNGVPWQPDHQYECDTCVAIYAPVHAIEPDMQCRAYRKGERCTGTLTRFGTGAGRGSHFRKKDA